MNLSAPFIRRPVATTLLTLGVTLAGADTRKYVAVDTRAVPRSPAASVTVIVCGPGTLKPAPVKVWTPLSPRTKV